MENTRLLDLGLDPITLEEDLLREVTEIAERYMHRCDRDKIPCRSLWVRRPRVARRSPRAPSIRRAAPAILFWVIARARVLPVTAGERGPARIGLGLAALGRPGYLNLGHGDDLGDDRSVGRRCERQRFAVLDAALRRGRALLRRRALLRPRRRSSSAPGCADRASRRTSSSAPSGATSTPRTGRSTPTRPRSSTTTSDTFRRQLEETRAQLGDRLALYQIHSATPDSGVLEDDAVLDELRDLRAAGVALGVTGSGAVAARDRSTGRASSGCFDAVQATWNLHERVGRPGAGARARRGHRGDRQGGARQRAAEARERRRRSSAWPRELGATADAVALAAVLAQPFADVVLSGAATPEALASNLAAAALDLPADALDELATLEEPADPYWAARGELAWT